MSVHLASVYEDKAGNRWVGPPDPERHWRRTGLVLRAAIDPMPESRAHRRSDVAEAEQRIAQLRAANGKLTFEQAQDEVFRNDPALYERCRTESYAGRRVAAVSAPDPQPQLVLTGAAAEIDRRATELRSKNPSLTLSQAQDQVFRNDPTLYDRYRRETTAR